MGTEQSHKPLWEAKGEVVGPRKKDKREFIGDKEEKEKTRG